MSDARGNSNAITREYLDSLLIETRYLDSVNPDPSFKLFGECFASPIMTAALSHLDHFMYEGAMKELAQGAADADAVMFMGMAREAEIEDLASTGARIVEIIKPYADRDVIYRKIEHAEKHGLLAVGVDIDHPFGPDGSDDYVDGQRMKALTSVELAELCKASRLPLVVKGVLSMKDAEKSLAAGAGGLLVSHHNNRIEYALPPLSILPEIVALTAKRAPVFVDCEIATGMDAFKALCLGATAVGIGRPLMGALKKNHAAGVSEYLNNAVDELKKAMAFTGCGDLTKMDPTIIHRRNF